MLEAVELSPNHRGIPSSSPTPRDLAALLFRHSKLITLSFGALFLVILAYAAWTPRYESHLKVLVRRARLDSPVSAQAAGAAAVAREEISEEDLNSEVELLRDESLLKEAVFAAQFVPAEASSRKVEKEVREVSRNLRVEPLRKSNLIQASYRSTSPSRAARLLTAMTAVYLQRHTELHRPRGEFHFFSQQTEELGKKLQESEDRLTRFTHTTGVASAAFERDIALQKLGDAEGNYRQIRQDSADTEKRLTALQQQIALFPPRSLKEMHSADNPELLQKLKTQLLELQLKRTELLTRFEPSYRLVQEVDQQIAQTRAALSGEAISPLREETTDKDPNYEWARIELEKAQVQRDSLKARESAAAAQIASLRETAQRLQSESIVQQDLQRTAKADEENYLISLRKQEEARVGDALDEKQIVNVAVVEPPVAPALPVHSILFYFFIAFAASCAFAVGAAFTAERFDPTLRTPEEAQRLLEMPVLAWLPAASAEGVEDTLTRARRKAVGQ
jgi:uncharacterized protein involved in exopolysaccharide biosynthesis